MNNGYFASMSRRQRKKSSAVKSVSNESGKESGKKSNKRFGGLWWKLLLGVFVVLLVGGIFAYNKVISFLHSDEFREDLAMQVGAEVGSKVEFGDFKWSGLSARNARVSVSGEGAIESAEVENLSLDVEMDFINRDKFTIKNVELDSVSVALDLRKEFLRFDRVEKEKGFLASLLPEEVEFEDAEIYNLAAVVKTNSGDFSVRGVRVKAENDDGTYNGFIDGGSVRLPFSFLTLATIEKGEISSTDEEIYVKDVSLRIFKSGKVHLNGVVDLAEGARQLYDMKGNLTGLNCMDVFPDNWHRHLRGGVEASFRIRPHEGIEPRIVGQLQINDGALMALPLLDEISKRFFEPKYKTLRFEKFRCGFEKYKEEITLSDIMLVSAGLLKIEGDIKIEGDRIHGLLDVGVPEIYISKIPGAKGNVFKHGKEGLLWTKVKIGGTSDNITEDLKDRLVNAAIDAVIGDVLKMTGKVVDPETVKKLLNAEGPNSEIIEKLMNKNEVMNPKFLLDFIGGVAGSKGGDGVLKNGLDTAKGVLDAVTGSGNGEGENKKDNGEKKDGGLIPDLNKILPF